MGVMEELWKISDFTAVNVTRGCGSCCLPMNAGSREGFAMILGELIRPE